MELSEKKSSRKKAKKSVRPEQKSEQLSEEFREKLKQQVEIRKQEAERLVAEAKVEQANKTKRDLSFYLSGVGTYLMAAAHTAATACRAAYTNPTMFTIGVALLIVGGALALYFGVIK